MSVVRERESTAVPQSEGPSTSGVKWFKRRRVSLIGVPVLLIGAIGGLFAWGRSQPRPEGYAVVVPNEPVETAADQALVEGPVVAPADEIHQYTLDATSREDFVLFDFVNGQVIEGDLRSGTWDVAFQRTILLTNSGATNPAGPAGAVDLGEAALADVQAPAAVEWVTDTMGGDDDDELVNEAAGRWYSYSMITHIVSTKPNIYLFRTGEEMDALVRFDSYYCEDEQPGCITFSYRLVPALDDV